MWAGEAAQGSCVESCCFWAASGIPQQQLPLQEPSAGVWTSWLPHPFLAWDSFNFEWVLVWIQPVKENRLNTLIPQKNGDPDAV